MATASGDAKGTCLPSTPVLGQNLRGQVPVIAELLQEVLSEYVFAVQTQWWDSRQR